MPLKLLFPLIVFLSGCGACRDREYPSHVSDRESEDCIKGKTYDSGPTHPTGYEELFDYVGIKD